MPKKKYKYIDTRQYPRLDLPYFLKYKLPESNKTKRANVKNISAGGVLFTVAEKIPASTVLELEISFTASPKPIIASAKVLRAIATKEPGFYEVGTQFIKISDEDRKIINDYIKQVIGKQTKKEWWRTV